MKRFFTALSLSALGAGLLASCSDRSEDPLSSETAAPATAYRTVSNAAAGNCEIPGCRPGFERTVGLGAVLDRAQHDIAESGGSGTFSLNSDKTELTYEIRVEGIPAVTGSHFHNAASGANGGVVRGLEGEFDGDVWVSSGTWTSSETDQPLTADLGAEIEAGNIYVNIHTADYPGGEVRGQVLAEGADFAATLERAQQNPPIPVSGGTGTFTLTFGPTQLAYEIRVEGIPTVAASHFHNAPAGENGGVARGIEGALDGDVWVSSGTWSADEVDSPLTPALVSELLAGNIYVNIHTADYGGGEVRGQVLK